MSHPLVVLWCHPRSLSSAVERAMLARGDLEVFHEPFLYLYYVHDRVRPLPHFEPDPERPASYEAIRDRLLAAAARGPVFVKDMSFYVASRIGADGDLLDRAVHSFLVRDPRRAIASYARLDPDLTCEEIGLEAQWRHFERVRERTGVVPAVIAAEDLQARPEALLRAYCEAVGLAFSPRMLRWEAELPPAWRDVAGWHEGVARSTGIAAPPAGPPPDLDRDPRLRAFLDHHRPYYERLRAHRLRPG